MSVRKPAISSSDKQLLAFVDEVTETLLAGDRHRTAGLGTFSTCTRKATLDRVACKMAMFRASSELREYAVGGPLPAVSGPHAEVVKRLIEAMLEGDGVAVPDLGRLAVIPVPGKKPKLIFHGAESLNGRLAAS